MSTEPEARVERICARLREMHEDMVLAMLELDTDAAFIPCTRQRRRAG